MKHNQSERTITAIHKERWSSIAIKYDDYTRFVRSFILPFRKYLVDNSLVTHFYHRISSPNNVIQLNFVTTPFYLKKVIKPFLIYMLNSYFDRDYLNENLGIDRIDLSMSEHKIGLDGIDLNNLKLFSTEDLYTCPITYSIGVHGGKDLSKLLAVSSNIYLDGLVNGTHSFHTQDCIEKSLSMNVSFLYYFIPDKKLQYPFLSWVTDSMLMQVNGSTDSILMDLESSYKEQKDLLSEYISYIEESITSEEPFDEEWINTWIKACQSHKVIMKDLSKTGKLNMPYDVKDDPTIRYSIDNKTYQDWQIAYFMLTSLNGQLGIHFTTELSILYWLKRALQDVTIEN